MCTSILTTRMRTRQPATTHTDGSVSTLTTVEAVTIEPAAIRVAVVWRGDAAARRAGIASNERLQPVVDALAALGVTAIPVIYRDEIADEVRADLLEVDGVLVWIDPIGHGEDRARFDAILHDVSSAGVWVSAHPETIALIGTKDVLYRTRSLSWGSDVHRYSTVSQLQAQLPARVSEGPRVVKRERGNAGIGVWKIEVPADSPRPITGATTVFVHGAEHRDTEVSEIELSAFFEICAPYFANGGLVIDQAFQPRVTEGLVRVYLVVDTVVGFSRQSAETLITDADSATRIMGLPSPKTMYPPDSPEFARLRAQLETEWVPRLRDLLALPRERLPAIWDADFLLGPPAHDGTDTYVLCEINCSCVTPFPPEAPEQIARATLTALGRL
jgi:hypothetical protein